MWPWRQQLVLLSALAAQNTVLVLLMKRTLTTHSHPSTLNVIAVELLKLTLCLLLELPRHQYRLQSVLRTIKADPQLARYAVPALLYAAQNNLCLVAMRRMGAVEYQVVYQSKILVTAVMAWWLLRRRMSGLQWFSLVLLILGVSIVAVSPSTSTTITIEARDKMVGLVALLLAAVSSGYCGVCLEGMAKDGSQQRRTVALQSLSLSLYSLPFSILLHLSNGHHLGTLTRLPSLLCTPQLQLVYCMQAGSGLLVGAVIRHSDNVLKGFATSVSLVASAMICEPGGRVVCGTVLVALAVCLFAGCPGFPGLGPGLGGLGIKRVKSVNI